MPLASSISFDLRSGQAIWLKGRNGSGKTSLLKAIAGLIRHEGEVSYDGISLTSVARMKLMATNYFDLKPFSQYNLHDFSAYIKAINGSCDVILPAALDHLKMQSLGQLSSGQLQLLKMFVINCSRKKIWLIDELDAHFDEENRACFMDGCRSFLSSGGFLVIVTHYGLEDLEYSKVVLDLSDAAVM